MYVTSLPQACPALALIVAFSFLNALASGYSVVRSGFEVHASALEILEPAAGSGFPVFGWKREVDTPAPPASKTIASNITLCVPLMACDTRSFEIDFLQRVNEQTLMPSELVVAVSGVSKEDSNRLEGLIRRVVTEIPVFVSSVEHNATAGENRNRCVNHSHGDVISFFDGDDVMHPRRTEMIDRIMREYHPLVLLHKFSFCPAGFFTQLPCTAKKNFHNSFGVVGPSTAKYEHFQTFNDSRASDIAQGWATVRREVFERTQYNETSREGEDIEFLSDVMNIYGSGTAGKTLIFTSLELGAYVPRRERAKRRIVQEARMHAFDRLASLDSDLRKLSTVLRSKKP